MNRATWQAALATAALAAAGAAQEFRAPVRLEADGKPISVDVGHAAPYVYDFDGDGVRDLLVGQFGQGRLRIYRNAGTSTKPRYEAPRWFRAAGKIATVPAGWCVGFGPQLVDLNGDGHDDVISGSYWHGHIFVFEGRGGGQFAEKYALADRDGVKLHAGRPWKSEKTPDLDSLAAAPHMVDFDADGDLDLLVGNIVGRVILIRNDGTATQPAFGKDRERLRAGGKPIRVPGGDAGPTTADWDGDGLWDLMVGAGDGSVWLYRNTGSAERPTFAPGRRLLRASSSGWQPLPHGTAPTRSGHRAKVCVVDMNGDGLLDLVVGDYRSVLGPAPKLTEDELAERDRLRKERATLSRKLGQIYKQHAKASAEKRKQASAGVQKRQREVYEKLRKLEPRREPAGWVWLYLQKGARSL